MRLPLLTQRRQAAGACTSPTALELARRQNDGLDITLRWHPADDAVTLSVADFRTGGEMQFAVEPARALHAFHHPFAYAP